MAELQNNQVAHFSPHTLQNGHSHYVTGQFTLSNRLLNLATSPATPYVPSTFETEISTVHYGRRQLLVNEIEFITICLNELEKLGKHTLKRRLIVFYGGAASGSHLLVLAEFFPFAKFILVDPQRFQLQYGRRELRRNFEFYNQNFDPPLARRFFSKYQDDTQFVRLFVSDIRSTDHDEQRISADHNLQAELHRILCPFRSYLKFRPPYVERLHNKNFEYLR